MAALRPPRSRRAEGEKPAVKNGFARPLLQWVLAPIAIAALAGVLGQRHASEQRAPFLEKTATLSPSDRNALESAPALAVANATWAFGSEEAVRKMVRTELDRLPESEGPSRARVFVRFGIIDTNPDGQAALFSQACVADSNDCEHLKEAAQREIQARFVAPGNHLPLYFSGGIPELPVRDEADGPQRWRARAPRGSSRSGERRGVAHARGPAVQGDVAERGRDRGGQHGPRPPRGAPSLERTVALARNAMAATSRLAEGLLARAPEGAVACRAGCDHCCYQAVGVTAPEALAIFDHLTRTRSTSELAQVAAQVAERHAGRGGCRPRSDSRPTIPARSSRRAVHDLRGPAAGLSRDELARRRGVRDAAARSGGAGGVPGERPRRALLHGADSRLPRGQRRPPARPVGALRPRHAAAGADRRPAPPAGGTASSPDEWIGGQTRRSNRPCRDASDAPMARAARPERSGSAAPRGQLA